MPQNIKATPNEGAMLALCPSPEAALAINEYTTGAFGGAEIKDATPTAPELQHAADLHVTLCYLGDAAAIQDKQAELVEALRPIAAAQQPFKAQLNGLGRFYDNPDKHCCYLNVDAPELAPFRQQLVAASTEAGVPPVLNHGYTPHITLAYLHPEAAQPSVLPKVTESMFDRLYLYLGNTRIELPFGEKAVEPVQGKVDQDVRGDEVSPSIEAKAVKSVITIHDLRRDNLPVDYAIDRTRLKAGSTVFTGADGLRYMFIVTSNGYKDREDEFVFTQALKSYVDSRWVANKRFISDNELLFWHEGDNVGSIVWADMEGPFLLEVAKEAPNRIVYLDKAHRVRSTVKQVWDYIEAHPEVGWGASHGFGYPASERGNYKHIQKFETSVLPLAYAANPYTYAGVMKNGRTR